MTTTRSTTTTVPRRQGQRPAGLPAPGRRAGSTYAPPRRRGGAQQAGGRPPARGALPTSRTASAGPGTGPGSGTWQAGGSERYGAPTGVILEGRAGVDLVRTRPVSPKLRRVPGRVWGLRGRRGAVGPPQLHTREDLPHNTADQQ